FYALVLSHPRYSLFPYTTLFRSLGREDVALGIRRDRMHGKELSRLATAVAECGEQRERLTVDHVHALILAVGQIQILLRRVARRSEEHTSELQSREKLVCRLLLE